MSDRNLQRMTQNKEKKKIICLYPTCCFKRRLIQQYYKHLLAVNLRDCDSSDVVSWELAGVQGMGTYNPWHMLGIGAEKLVFFSEV